MLAIKNLTKSRLPTLPFDQVARHSLTTNYELSLVFTDRKLSQRLNRIYRAKDRPTNILSFPLSATAGEIIIDLARVKQEAPTGNWPEHLFDLFIHGVLHLKGLVHGSTMEHEEQKLKRLFSPTHGPQNRHRTRSRHLVNSFGGVRTRRRH